MSAQFLAVNGSAQNDTTTGLTTLNFVTTRDIQIGEHVVVAAFAQPSTLSGVTSVTVGSLSLAPRVQGVNVDEIWSAHATSLIPTGSTVSIHYTGTNAGIVWTGGVCLSLSGVDSASPVWTTAAKNGVSATPDTGVATNVAAGMCGVAAIQWDNTTNLNSQTYTSRAQVYDAAFGDGGNCATNDYAAPAASTQDSYTFSANASYAACIAIFQAGSQFARPDADVADGGWTNEAGSNVNLFASIDETVASDADYIQSGLSPSTADVVEINLSDVTP